jgi:ABC-type transporter Mla subunit MlaD
VVSATIDPRYGPLYRDARVQIRPNTPLQDMYVDIVSRGTAAAGAIRRGGALALSQTESPVQIGSVIDIFDAAVRPRVSAAIDALGAGLADHGRQLRESLVDLAPFLRVAQQFTLQIARRQTETARLIHNFALLSSELANRSNELTGLVRAGAVTFERLATMQQPLGAVIEQLPPTLTQLPRSFTAVDAAAAQIDLAARALLPVADRLAPALTALRKVSPVASTALTALDHPLPGLTALLRRATPLASDLGQSFSLLRPQAPQLDRATAAIIPCETAVKDFFQWTLSVSKLWGVVGVMQRGVAMEGTTAGTDLLAPGFKGDRTVLSLAPTCAPTTAAIR